MSMKQWTVLTDSKGNRESLKLEEVPKPTAGPLQVLIKVHALSLNYRDHAIMSNNYPADVKDHLVPVSDGAGEIVAVGDGVTQWKVGDKVMGQFSLAHQAGHVSEATQATTLGGMADGLARECAALPESGVVRVPEGYSYEQAATLPCAAVTAWNALLGLEGRQLAPGQWVVTQGTGGVSVFAVQIAKATGARVIATTSSAEKAQLLKKLGADHVINYKDTPQWGDEVRKIAPQGADHIVEVGGSGTLNESLKAIKKEGVISMVGFVAGGTAPPLLEALVKSCIVRGIAVGSKLQFEELVACIDANGIKPVIDGTTFSFEELPKAYEHLAKARHVGKIVVTFD